MEHYGTHDDNTWLTGRRSESAGVDTRASQTLHGLFPGVDLAPCEVSEWVYLNEGDRVVAQRPREYPKAGEVDVVSEDAFVLWLLLDNGEGRVMVSAEDNAKLWRLS